MMPRVLKNVYAAATSGVFLLVLFGALFAPLNTDRVRTSEGAWVAVSMAQGTDEVAEGTADAVKTSEQAAKDKAAGVNQTTNTGALAWLAGKAAAPFLAAFKFIVLVIGEFFISILTFLLFLSGVLFDTIFEITVLNFAGITNSALGVVGIAWATIRDLANLIFIFGLLVVAIATILQIESYGMKRLLAGILIAALLVNFSLFFSKVIIDGANGLAVSFYNSAAPAFQASGGYQGISVPFINFVGPQSIWDAIPSSGIFDTSATTVAQTLLIITMGIIINGVLAGLFLAAAIILLIRFAMLIMVMIFSPVGIAFMAIPHLQKYASDWWNHLFKNALYAPIFMLFIWIDVKIISNNEFKNFLFGGKQASFATLNELGKNGTVFTDTTSQAAGAIGSAAAGVAKAIVTPSFIAAFIGFFFVTILLWMTIQVASTFSVKGATWAQKVGMGFVTGATLGGTAFAGRNIFGRGFSRIASSEWLKDQAAKSGVAGALGRVGLRASAGIASSNFDARSSKTLSAISETYGGGSLKAGGAGGFEKAMRDDAKKKMELEKLLKPGEEAKARYAAQKKALEEAQGTELRAPEGEHAAAKTTHETAEADLRRAERELERRKASGASTNLIRSAENAVAAAQTNASSTKAALGAAQEALNKVRAQQEAALGKINKKISGKERITAYSQALTTRGINNLRFPSRASRIASYTLQDKLNKSEKDKLLETLVEATKEAEKGKGESKKEETGGGH